jgi:hypothetical protein
VSVVWPGITVGAVVTLFAVYAFIVLSARACEFRSAGRLVDSTA